PLRRGHSARRLSLAQGPENRQPVIRICPRSSPGFSVAWRTASGSHTIVLPFRPREFDPEPAKTVRPKIEVRHTAISLLAQRPRRRLAHQVTVIPAPAIV